MCTMKKVWGGDPWTEASNFARRPSKRSKMHHLKNWQRKEEGASLRWKEWEAAMAMLLVVLRLGGLLDER